MCCRLPLLLLDRCLLICLGRHVAWGYKQQLNPASTSDWDGLLAQTHGASTRHEQPHAPPVSTPASSMVPQQTQDTLVHGKSVMLFHSSHWFSAMSPRSLHQLDATHGFANLQL